MKSPWKGVNILVSRPFSVAHLDARPVLLPSRPVCLVIVLVHATITTYLHSSLSATCLVSLPGPP